MPFLDLLPRGELSRRRAALLSRIERRFNTVTESLHFGPSKLDFTRVEDPNVVLDQVASEEDRREKLTGDGRDGNDLHLPYWAELWDSAFGIAEYLVRSDHTVTRWQGDKAKDPPTHCVTRSSF